MWHRQICSYKFIIYSFNICFYIQVIEQQKMAKIRKGFSITITILGVLCLIWGICISVISWVLAAKTPRFITVKDMNSNTILSTRSSSIYKYWWGGLGVSIKQRCI